MPASKSVLIGEDPLWYKDAIVYELHVRSFADSNADGIGDFAGLTGKLDYLQDLGITAIWLLPFYPSPLKDDGYDIADYSGINPIYGSLEDFKRFLDEAHARQLRVITELVINHTSDQHPWFQAARRAPAGSVARDYYVWSDSPEKYREARIIFRDFEPSNWSWDPVAKAYYWHRFYAHQPDLNFDNAAVHKELLRVLDFWLDLGVDGLRLDAVPYLYEREGTSCENLPETHQFLKLLRSHVDEKYGDRMLLAEANQWPEDSVAYLGGGKGDECHMAFHFPLMPRLFMAVRMEDRVPIIDILEQTPPIPETSQWALFLRNHDELTLEMVTDEERDYMYRVYANDAKARINLGIRRRLAPLLGKDRKRIELLHLLLFSYPGTPFLYYGDEIGMGDNIYLGDRNGVRTPMQWNSDKNAGFSRAHPHALFLPIIVDPEYHYEAVNVEAQRGNTHSLWWWVKRVLALRKRYRAFGRGTIQFLTPENRKILAFIRRHDDEIILVVANLSRFSQPASLDLSEFKNKIPVELFGRTRFPTINKTPYSLTLSPHTAFWFVIEPQTPANHLESISQAPLITLKKELPELWQRTAPPTFETGLTAWLVHRRWFSGKGREIRVVQVRDALDVLTAPNVGYILLLHVEYVEGDSQEYLLPVAFLSGPEGESVAERSPGLLIARIQFKHNQTEGILIDALGSKEFSRAILDAIHSSRSFAGWEGELKARSQGEFHSETHPEHALEPALPKAEQSNSSIIFGDKYFLKLFRTLEPGVHPDLEIGTFLTQRKFPHVPAVAGSLEYFRKNGEQLSFGILTHYFPTAQDAWQFTLETLTRYYDRVRALGQGPEPTPPTSLLALAQSDLPETVVGMLGTYVEAARLLGQRSGELHLALASDPGNPDFAPEPFTPFYQRALYQSMRNLTVRTFDQLRRSLPRVPDVRPQAESLLARQAGMLKRLRALYESRVTAKRIRCHGDYHLGQVLHTGKDFIVIDFEGEPSRSLSERRIKRSPLRDVAGMIRSFDYVAYAALLRNAELGTFRPEQLPMLEPWADFWQRNISAVFLRAYLQVMATADLLPRNNPELEVLLNAHLLEKAVYEVGYELNNRPNWIKIPLRGILLLLGPET